MKFLVTGNRGFIGSHMSKTLTELGHTVTTFEWGETWPGVQGQDWVIHIGAISSTTEKDANKLYTQNFEFSVRLHQECKKHNVNLQYSSSASVYGLLSEFKEDSPVDPRTGYAWSKYFFERYATQNQGINIVQGFRYFNVYGSGEDHKGSQASPFHQFAMQAKTGVIKVFENSDDYHRDFVPVETVIDTHLKFFNVEESGIWNVGTGKTMSFLDVAKTFNAEIQEIPMPKILEHSYQTYTCADMSKTNATLERYKI